MAICFVMQPFDRDKFDRRFDDVFGPAIKAAGLEPYRTDRDPGVSIPIEEIEKGISGADVCFAEVTTDNPNVWFELGYAIAKDKAVCLVCSEERTTPFPFDVRHRTIIEYRVGSTSDFKRLGMAVTERLQAILERERSMATLDSLKPVATTAGLSPHEYTALAIIASNLNSEGCPEYEVRQAVRKAGYTDIAAGLAVQSLRRKGFVNIAEAESFRDDPYMLLKATEPGVDWLLGNMANLDLRVAPPDEPPAEKSGDDIPF
jgi:hypothetical protein